MGASVLSLPVYTSIPGAATAIAGAAGCFAFGYLVALARLPRHAAAPASGALSDDDSKDDSEEDDDENSGRSRTAKRAAGRKRTGLRLLFWSKRRRPKNRRHRLSSAFRASASLFRSPRCVLGVEQLRVVEEGKRMGGGEPKAATWPPKAPAQEARLAAQPQEARDSRMKIFSGTANRPLAQVPAKESKFV